ncbi:MAG: hypothetical protein V4592_25315 [Bacteroidota bacterium]
MKFGLIVWLLLVGVMLGAFAQERAVEGIVFDKASKERIARVNILNIRTKQSIYNTLKADFKITALPDDQLIVSKQGYFTDTIKVPANNTLLIYLKPTATLLKQVNVRDTIQSPQKRYLATKSEYSKAYGSNAYRDPLSLSPGSGAGISIDAIWNSLSRSGRNAERLQGIIERDYHESEIDFRFNRAFVGSITHLRDPQLTDFMQKYRPGYYAVINDDQYAFIASIRANLKRYLRNPRAFTLPPLIKPE